LRFSQINRHSLGMEISPAQCRAARALLDWTQGELADKVGVAVKTIRNFEGGLRTPHNLSRVSIKQALEKAGIDFLANDGVRRKG
jgi:DNA-binding XRE family transcriptional regulator